MAKQALDWPCNVSLWLNAWVDYDFCYKNNVKIDFCMIGVFLLRFNDQILFFVEIKYVEKKFVENNSSTDSNLD